MSVTMEKTVALNLKKRFTPDMKGLHGKVK